MRHRLPVPAALLVVAFGGVLLASCGSDDGPTGPGPSADFTVTPDPGNTATIFEFDGSSTDDGVIRTFIWRFGDGNQGEGAQTSHRYDAPGTYMVELTVTDDAGRTDTASRSLEVLEEVELPTSDAMALPDEPSFLDDVLGEAGHPDDVYDALVQVGASPALANLHLAVPVDLSALGLGPAVYVPVQVTPREGDAAPPHGRPSLYFIEAGTEVLSGIYVTEAGLALRYTERVTGDGGEAQSGDLYSERLVTVEGETIFQGFGELEILDAESGHGQVALTRDANNVPLPEDREVKVQVWVLWSSIIIESEAEADPDEPVSLPRTPPAMEELQAAVSGPDGIYGAARELGIPPRLLNPHAAVPVDLTAKGLGPAVHIPVQILPDEDRDAFHGRKSIYFLAEGEEVLAGVYFTSSGLALRYLTRVRGDGDQARTGDVYRERLVARDGTVVHDAQGELEIQDPDAGLGRIVFERTADGEPVDWEVWVLWSMIIVTDADEES